LTLRDGMLVEDARRPKQEVTRIASN